MIAFDCPGCGKPLIVPNQRTGDVMPCPGCGRELLVPAPPPPRREPNRKFRLVVGLSIVAVVLALVGWQVWKARRAARVQERFVAALKARSPSWQGVNWLQCDPVKGEYKVELYFSGEGELYAFEVTHWQTADQTFVRVSAQATALGYAALRGGVVDLFDYHGKDALEKAHLEDLGGEVDGALRQALR